MRSSRSEIDENKKNTKILIAYFLCIFICIGALISIIVLLFNNNLNFYDGLKIIFYFLLFSVVYVLFAYYRMNKIAIGSVQGKEITEDDNSQVYHIVQELTLAARLPMPKVYVVDDMSPNAFATGRDPQHATVCVTKGLLSLMNREELEAVIGHELSHIKNYDIRVSTLAATLASVIMGIGVALVLTARIIFELNYWSNSDDDNDSREFKLFILLFGVGLFVVGILVKFIGMPLARLIELAISRQREYLADVSSTNLTHDPEGMINALEKLKDDDTPTTKNLTIVNQLCLVTPKFKKIGSKVKKNIINFDTHPSLDDRINRLRELQASSDLEK